MERAKKIAKSIPFFILLCMLAGSVRATAETTVSAATDHDKIGEEDQLTLTVTIEGEGSHSVDFIDLPDLDGFDVVSSSQRSAINIINGVTTSSKTFVFTLLPRKQGTYEIPPISLEIGGKVLKTEPIQVTVVAGSIIAPPSSRSNPWLDPWFDPFSRRRSGQRAKKEPVGDDVFVRAEVSDKEIFYGEQVTLIYKLYTRYNIRSIDMSQSSLTGFWVEPVELPQRLKPTVTSINGRKYSVFVFKKFVLFPSATGALVIDPVTCTIDIQPRSTDPFFGSFFMDEERIYRKTREQTVMVKALPDLNKPSDFSGAVGDFSLKADIDKTETKVNDAINLKITIAGKGNLKAVNKPELAEHPDFKIFDSKESTDVGFKGGFFQGSRSWEYVLVPISAGELTIDPLRFAYFNPETGEYRIEKSAPFRIQVAPGDAQEEMMISSSLPEGREIKRRRRDIHYIKPVPVRLTNEDAYVYQNGYFVLIVLLPILANLGALVFRKKKESRWRDTAGFRFRQARRTADRSLRIARKALKSGEKENFFEALARCLHIYLADKLNLDAGGLTVETTEKALLEKKISASAMEGVKNCLDHVDLARFGRHESTEQEMEALYRECRRTISMLEKEIRTK